MKRLLVAVLVMSALSWAETARALNNGTADPLGLIGFAAIQPFWSAGENVTIIEITSPVGFNSAPALHGVFFDAACNRDQSVPLPVTENGVLLFSPDDIGIDYNGLALIASTVNGLTLVPVNPIHVMAQWASIVNDHIRVVDPISVAAADTSVLQTWNPVRSAASWVNPREDATFHTTIFLVCPSSAVISEIPPERGFPAAPSIAFGTKDTSSIVGVIYDEDELPLRNVSVPCVCLTSLPVLTINGVYADPFVSPLAGLFYTEILSRSANFTGYRSIVVTAGSLVGGQLDDFGRLNNGSSSIYTTPPSLPPGLALPASSSPVR